MNSLYASNDLSSFKWSKTNKMDEVNGVDEVQEVNKVDVMDAMLEGVIFFLSHNDQKVWKIKGEEAKDKLELEEMVEMDEVNDLTGQLVQMLKLSKWF